MAENSKSNRAKREEEVLKFWKENRIFEKSLEKPAPEGEFVFYDGPPFATGLPHYGHILPGTIKDVIPRYKTMRGFHVPRRWGWDCHGLPIENLVEQELGLETKKDIEKFGIAEFNERARASVLRYEKEWKEIIPRTGRWVDMDNAYKTMDTSYTEAVWWSFSNLYNKELVYKGFKSMHICPRCGTPLSNFEVNQGYKDIVDLSVTVELESLERPNTFFLAWTTTPWTLPGNVALAVNPEVEYAEVSGEVEGNTYILAFSRIENVFGSKHKILRKFLGKDLIGKKYKTLFDYYFTEGQVYGAEFVTTEEGTGIVHIAPAFGEDDYRLSLEHDLPFVQHVGIDGRFKLEVKDFAGELVKPKDDHQATDIKIIQYLAHKNLLFAKEKITHSYPHCWRCDTPLLNYATSSWFVKVADIKDKLLKNNKKTDWVPEDIRDGRFGKWLEGARDWAVSRSRFWGTPLPVWQRVLTNDQRPTTNNEYLVIDSIETLKKYTKKSGNKYFLMRHGEAMYNAKHVLDPQGDPNNHLTEKGKEEAASAARKLGSLDLIVSSPFLRTRETAELVRQELGLPESVLVIDERLHEFNESDVSHVRRRVGDFIYETERIYSGKKILIISHGNPLWVLEKIAEGNGSDIFAEKQMLDTGEVRELDFAPLPHSEAYELDLHKPYIDEVVLVENGEEYGRVSEVFDTWYDSGSVPFASRSARDLKPADFIAEGLDQTRGWFYTLLVLSTALFGKPPYKQVVVNGLVLAEDGKKMSKRLKNYPELSYVLDKYGADALRYYLISSPAVRAEDIAFSEKGLDEVSKKIILRLLNVLSFYELYKGTSAEEDGKHVLDRWIETRLSELKKEVTGALERYELDKASRPISDFVDDLSTWYLRRSRTRPQALPKLRAVLLELAKVLAPFMPFVAEEIHQALKDGNSSESVHLSSWPEAGKVDKKVLENMAETRRLVSLALEQRSKANIKVRQPLGKLEVRSLKLGGEYIQLILDEVNIKEVVENPSLDTEVRLDTTITPELEEEGRVREAIRSIQDLRKEKGLKPGEKMKYEVVDENKELFYKHGDEIKKATGIEILNPNI